MFMIRVSALVSRYHYVLKTEDFINNVDLKWNRKLSL